ncbi:MAG: Asp-tRNA(Asn)/Glu-tRNA(Gln) amidotransferase GatCAB subunit B, partial [Phycisphaerae bacterium]|nr:Asp-tRNA(Asn)/Glu-tRNA(Gln) amidotransferase GatCAB subunit B [Phycisphaerae bacterium]
PDAYPLTPEALAEVVKLQNDGTISKQAGDEVLTAMIDEGKAAQQIVEEKGLAQISDTGELDAAVDKVIAENPEPVADFRAGKKKALGRLIGEVMKASKGKANPQVAKSILEKKLSQ